MWWLLHNCSKRSCKLKLVNPYLLPAHLTVHSGSENISVGWREVDQWRSHCPNSLLHTNMSVCTTNCQFIVFFSWYTGTQTKCFSKDLKCYHFKIFLELLLHHHLQFKMLPAVSSASSCFVYNILHGTPKDQALFLYM